MSVQGPRRCPRPAPPLLPEAAGNTRLGFAPAESPGCRNENGPALPPGPFPVLPSPHYRLTEEAPRQELPRIREQIRNQADPGATNGTWNLEQAHRGTATQSDADSPAGRI